MIEVKVTQQARQSLVMKVTPKGIDVLIPHHLNPDSERVQRFIDEGLQKLAPPSTDSPSLTKAEIVALVDAWANKLDVTVNRVQIRPMRQKWGSISTAGTLTLADDLLKLPSHLVEYVIVHELLHLKVSHHNRLFYLLLDQHIPAWRQREQELGRWVLKIQNFPQNLTDF